MMLIGAAGRPRRRFAAVVALWIVLASAARAEEAPQPAPPKDKVPPPSLVRLLPEDTLFVITFRDLRSSLEKLKRASLWKVGSDASVQALVAKPIGDLKTRFQAAQQQFKLDTQTLVDALQGELTIAVMDFKPREGGGPPDVAVAIGLQVGDKGDKLLASLDDMIGTLVMMAGGAVQYTTYPYEGQTIRMVSTLQPNMPTVVFTIADGTLIATVGQKRLEDLLFARRKEQDAGLLRGLPSFQSALARIGGSHDAAIYLNVLRLLSLPPLRIGDAERAKMDALGLTGIRAVAYGVRIEGTGFREVFHIDAAERKGLLKLVEGLPLTSSGLKHVPANASVALAARIAPELAYDAFLDLVQTDNPAERARIEAAVKNFEDTANLSFKRDILGAFTGDVSLGVAMKPSAGALPAGLIPDALLHVGIQSPLKLEGTIAALQKLAPKSIEFQDVRLSGHPATVIRRRPGEGNPMAVTYSLVQDRLVAGLYPLAMRNFLATVADQPPPSLADSPAYKELVSHLTGKPSLLLYADLGAALTLLYNTAAPILQIDGKAGRVIDLNQLPDGELIRRNFGPAVLAWSADEKGLFVEGYSHTGMVLPAVVAGGALAAVTYRRAQFGGNNVRRAELSAAGAAIRAYAVDNAGQYPKTLNDLVPRYLDRVPEGEPLVYRGQQDKPSGIVAYVRPEMMRGPSCFVLLQDGAIRSVNKGALDAALEQGFDPGAPQGGPRQPRPAPQPPKGPDERF